MARPLPGRAARAALSALWAMAALATCPAGWAACADGGVGGTGAVARGGVGGTGISDAPGTVGVVGVITGFASVCVNGLEIHYGPGTPVTINGRPAGTAQLALGQVVAVEAQPEAGQLSARSLAVTWTLEGPVTRMDADAGMVFVMGRAIRVTAETVTAAVGQPLAGIAPGVTVQVSGFRDSRGEIVASRLDLGTPGEHSVIGRMTQRDAWSGEIEGLPVTLSAARPQGEGEVLVRGRWDGERLRATSVVEAPATTLLGRVNRAVIESLVREVRSGDRLRVGEFDVSIRRGTGIATDKLRLDQRVRITGTPDRGSIAAERIEIPRENPARPGGTERRSEPGGSSQGQGEGERPDPADPGGERAERPDSPSPGKAERIDRPESAGLGKAERIERPESAGPGKPERVERPERPDNPGKGKGGRP